MNYFDITIPCQSFTERVVQPTRRLLTLNGVSDNDLATAISETASHIAQQYIRVDEGGECPNCSEMYAKLDVLQEAYDSLQAAYVGTEDAPAKNCTATEKVLAASEHERGVVALFEQQLAEAKDRLTQSYIERASLLTDIEQLLNERDMFQQKTVKLYEKLTAYCTRLENLDGGCATRKENAYGNVKDCDSMHAVQD